MINAETVQVDFQVSDYACGSDLSGVSYRERRYGELSVREGWCRMRLRYGRVRSAERAEAHLLEINLCEPSFGPMCGQRAIR
jgi:hypothetical protein